jgi:uncharacterized membrane protein YeaQ/YmgE (transglycosylase-associated protein family)
LPPQLSRRLWCSRNDPANNSAGLSAAPAPSQATRREARSTETQNGYGLGLVGDIVVGVIGSFIGGWLFSYFHLVHGAGFIGNLIGATVGAILLLVVLRLVRRTA